MEMGRDLWASSILDEGVACPLVGSTNGVVVGYMLAFVGESFGAEGRLGGCNSRCCCRGMLVSDVFADLLGLGNVLESRPA